MIKLIVLGIVAAAIAGFAFTAWNGFKNSIGQPYAEAQRKADQVIIDKAERAQAAAESERDNAVADTVACVATAAKQSDAVDKWRDIAHRNILAAQKVKEQAQREASAAAPKIADLQAKAAAAPKLMACEEELGKAKEVLRDALRTRRGLPTGPAPKAEDERVRALGLTPPGPAVK